MTYVRKRSSTISVGGVVAGDGALAIGGSIANATAGSVLFAGTGGVLAQSNGKLFWDDTNQTLKIGAQGVGSETKILLSHQEPGGGNPNARTGIRAATFEVTNNGTYYNNTSYFGWNPNLAQSDEAMFALAVESKFAQGSGQPFGGEIHLTGRFPDGKETRAFSAWIDRAAPHKASIMMCGQVDFLTSSTDVALKTNLRIYETGGATFWNVGPSGGSFSLCTFANGASETGKYQLQFVGDDDYPAINFKKSGALVSYFTTNLNNGTITAYVKTGGSFEVRNGGLFTQAPASGTSGVWKLGNVATVSPTSPNRTVRVDIDGTAYYIAAKTTND